MQSPHQESLVCHRAARALLAGLLVVMGAFTALIATPQNASAASYRYWSYWLGSDAGWNYSSWGPASLRPADGSVEGWRFGVSTGNTGAGLQPRTDADFDRICADTPAEDGRKRVAIVIDPGLAADAPTGEAPGGLWAMCVSAAESATGADILRSAASVRTQAGMVCGVAGYPARECAVILGGDSANPGDSSDRSPAPTPTSPPPSSAAPTVAPRPTPTTSAPSPETASESVPAPSPTATSGSSPATSPGTEAISGSGEPDPERASPASEPTPQPVESSRSGAPSTPASAQPSPEVSIVTAAVSGPGSGPGPGMAIIGGVVIVAILAAAMFQRRRATQ